MQSEISHPRNFAQLERWFACSRPLLEAKRCGIRVENKTVHTMAKHILKREQGESPSIVGAAWQKASNTFFSMLETAPFWAAQESYFDSGGGGKKTNPTKIGTIDLHWLWHLEIVVAAADENRERKLAAESRDDLLQGNKATRKLHIS